MNANQISNHFHSLNLKPDTASPCAQASTPGSVWSFNGIPRKGATVLRIVLSDEGELSVLCFVGYLVQYEIQLGMLTPVPVVVATVHAAIKAAVAAQVRTVAVPAKDCPDCDGMGAFNRTYTRSVAPSDPGSRACSRCHGTGKL